MNGVTVHVHNGIRYSVNSEGRCDWYSCTHNVYNSFDEPESIEVMRIITLNEHDMGCEHSPNDRVTCGTCQRSWCDICNPTPSARCLFEYEHDDVFEYEEDDKVYSPFGRDKRSVRITEEDAQKLRNYAEVALSEVNRPKPEVGMVVCDCKYKHQKIVEVFHEDGDTIKLEDGSYCSYFHCTNNVPHFDWDHPSGPCPTCGAFGGFHNDAKHQEINIDPKYLKDKGWHNV